MALRDQPYFPLYVQDYLTDEKLNMCSASSQGIYIKIMCLLHKSNPYGTILLKQKDKQNSSTCLNFACKFARLLPFELLELELAVCELIEEGVLTIDGDTLYQKRMVRDNKISEIRSDSGKKGGIKTQKKNNRFAKAKLKQNTEYEYEDENSILEEESKSISTKSTRKIEGKRLETFMAFWDIFDYKRGRAEAADAWLNIPKLTAVICEQINKAARIEAENRKLIIEAGKSPIMAQGWISSRRWEDEIYTEPQKKQNGQAQNQTPPLKAI